MTGTSTAFGPTLPGCDEVIANIFAGKMTGLGLEVRDHAASFKFAFDDEGIRKLC